MLQADESKELHQRENSPLQKKAIYVPADPLRHLSLGTRLTIDRESFWQLLVLHRHVSSCWIVL